LGRSKNWELLDATHRVLWEHHELWGPRRGTNAEIGERIREIGYVFAPNSVGDYLRELREIGILEPRTNRPRLPPLYPALLLADLPLPRLEDLSGVLDRHAQRVRALRGQGDPAAKAARQLPLFLEPEHTIDLLKGWPSVLVRTRGTETLLLKLQRDCDRVARGARLLLVEVPAKARRPRKPRNLTRAA
jgi:hypothetical protein